MTKRDLQKAATQERIVAAALKLFSHEGFEDVTMRQIAKAANVSTGALFANWPGKAALFKAATGHEAPDAVAFLARVVAVCVGRDDEGLRALARDAEAMRRHMIGHHS